MIASYILAIALSIVPSDVEVHITDFKDLDIVGEYDNGIIYLSRDIRRFELKMTIWHELGHYDFEHRSARQQERIRKRLSERPYMYYKDFREEYAELYALSHLR